MSHKIYTIAPSQNFAQTLVQHYVADDHIHSTRDILLLPTRRACRIVTEAFSQEAQTRSMVLPRIHAIDDIADDDLMAALFGADILDYGDVIPPQISKQKRHIMLARMIAALPQYHDRWAHALKLSHTLGQLLDHIYTENLDIEALHTLVPDDLAKHWQITLDFLKIISQQWPLVLAENGEIDVADRRNRALLKCADFIESMPSPPPIMIAGTTGSIPATARLIDVIARQKTGAVVLPGVDLDMDEKSWDALTEDHPQFGLKRILNRLDKDRAQIQDLKTRQGDDAREYLAREIMRPADTIEAWSDLSGNSHLQEGLKKCALVTCDHEQDEALTIALVMREALETPDKTAILITPDRTLAKRVQTALKRWQITIDDSAGVPLTRAVIGRYMLAILEMLAQACAPVSLFNLLDHQCCRVLDQETRHALDRALRGVEPYHDGKGFLSWLEKQDTIIAACTPLIHALTPLMDLCAHGQNDFFVWLDAHKRCAETLYGDEDVWAMQGGQDVLQYYDDVMDFKTDFPPMDLQAYLDTVKHMMDTYSVRPAYGAHPQLQILGQLEARMVDADIVIMSGLNEGIWPADSGHDPWMSRPMRGDFGLPPDERHIGLAAHDFVQGLCSPSVIMTRSVKQDGKPTIPSRWLQRLEAVIHAAELSPEILRHHDLEFWRDHVDQPEQIRFLDRPAPTPPIAARPNKLSVTKIQTWLNNPYGIYAAAVLRLRSLEPLEDKADHVLKGNVLHAALETFVKEPQSLSFLDHAESARTAFSVKDDQWQFWRSRFATIGEYIKAHEKTREDGWHTVATEAWGAATIDGFTLYGIVDRIDQNGHAAAIIDYKSGGNYTKNKIENGNLPQLALEALILTDGTFKDTPPLSPQSLEYWVLTGSDRMKKPVILDHDVAGVVERTREGLQGLIEVYQNPETPYHSYPDPARTVTYDDYEHLSRLREWGVLSDAEEAGETSW